LAAVPLRNTSSAINSSDLSTGRSTTSMPKVPGQGENAVAGNAFENVLLVAGGNQLALADDEHIHPEASLTLPWEFIKIASSKPDSMASVLANDEVM
jgi:hypothetical protein